MFIERYPKLLSVTDKELDKVREEFLDYQAMSMDEIPQDVWNDAACYEVGECSEKVTYHRMDRVWSYISEMKLPGIDIKRFGRLAKDASVVLTIPHSNAGEERVFSVIRKIRRDDRANLHLQGTLFSLITVKLNLHES